MNTTKKLLIGLGVALGGVWAVNTFRQFANGALYVGKPKITKTEPHTISFQNILSNALFPKVFLVMPFKNMTNINVHFKGASGKLILFRPQPDGTFKESLNLGSFAIAEQAADLLPDGVLEAEVIVELKLSTLIMLANEGFTSWQQLMSNDIRLKGAWFTTMATGKFEESII